MAHQENLDKFWNKLNQEGVAALTDEVPTSALEAFYLSIVLFGHQHFEHALTYMQQAVQFDPDNLVYGEAERYLKLVLREGKQQVYTDPAAFAAYIRGGGNVPLYEAVSAALQAVYREYVHMRLLDVGVGDGRALLPALTDNITNLTLLEPSHNLLAATQTSLDETGIAYRAYQETLQSFAQCEQPRWDVIQATFSLQSISFEERALMLKWLREHARRLLIVEFDVPQYEHLYDPQRVCSMPRQFQTGMLEYEEDRELVTRGFLIPILFGFFDQTAARINFEQPLRVWVEQVKAVGFERVDPVHFIPTGGRRLL